MATVVLLAAEKWECHPFLGKMMPGMRKCVTQSYAKAVAVKVFKKTIQSPHKQQWQLSMLYEARSKKIQLKEINIRTR